MVFALLSSQRRRRVIHVLKRADGTVSLRDLSQQVAAWENGVTVRDLTYKQRKRVYTSLHQTHLPKLADAGVVAYDRDRGTVELDDAVAELDVYLEPASTDVTPWSGYYLGLAGVSLLTVVLAWLGVPPFALVPDIAYGGLIALAVAVLAGAQFYSIRGSWPGGRNAETSTAAAASDADAPAGGERN